MVGDVLSEAPRGGDPNRSGVSDVVVNEMRRHGRTQVRQRAGVADVSVEPGDRGLAYGTIVEPHGWDDAEVVVVLGSLDPGEVERCPPPKAIIQRRAPNGPRNALALYPPASLWRGAPNRGTTSSVIPPGEGIRSWRASCK